MRAGAWGSEYAQSKNQGHSATAPYSLAKGAHHLVHLRQTEKGCKGQGHGGPKLPHAGRRVGQPSKLTQTELRQGTASQRHSATRTRKKGTRPGPAKLLRRHTGTRPMRERAQAKTPHAATRNPRPRPPPSTVQRGPATLAANTERADAPPQGAQSHGGPRRSRLERCSIPQALTQAPPSARKAKVLQLDRRCFQIHGSGVPLPAISPSVSSLQSGAPGSPKGSNAATRRPDQRRVRGRAPALGAGARPR
jgi:hypothetical protein